MRPAHNPFATGRLDGLVFRLHRDTWSEVLTRLERLAFRAGVVGGHGSGKTACLEELCRRLVGRGVDARLERARPGTGRTWSRLRRLQPQPATVVLLDSAEILGPLEWFLVARRTTRWGGCVVTGHRPGRLPTLVECRTSVGLLRDLVDELAPDLALEREVDLAALWALHRGDLRACLLALYDHCAGRSPRAAG